jgi:CRP-like cAMP-binding protein
MAIIDSARPAPVGCEFCPLHQFARLRKLGPDDLAFLAKFKIGEAWFDPGAPILQEGTPDGRLYTVLAGWGYRYKLLDDGRRQVLNFIMPGDLLGLQAATMDEMHHSVEALTPMRLCVFQRDRLWDFYKSLPSLAYDITWLASRSEIILDETILTLGRLTATERVAHLLLHLYDRAAGVGLADKDQIRLPFTQQLFADALGLSLVHTNKTLRRMQSKKLIRWVDGECEILDRDELERVGHYDGRDLPPQPFI